MPARLPILAMLVSFVGLSATLGLAEIAPPPRPPAGWKNDMTSGFDPSIEESVVELVNDFYPEFPKAADERIEDLWKGWGKDAVKPLTALYDNAAWEGFMPVVVRVLASSPYRTAHQFLKEELQKPSAQSHRQNLIIWTLSVKQPEFAMTLFVDLLENDNEQAQRNAVQGLFSLRTPESMAKAKEALMNLPEPVQAEFRRQMEYMESFVRAQEPMERILAKEKENGS